MRPYIPLAMWIGTCGVMQWYTKRPGCIAFHWKSFSSPGATCTEPPPPGPVAAWKLTECQFMLDLAFFRRMRRVSPTRTRMNGPGTVPLNVQNLYVTSLARRPLTSVVSKETRRSEERRVGKEGEDRGECGQEKERE